MLLGLLVGAFVRTGPVVVGIKETMERRWGEQIAARGIYRDSVRSSHDHVVKASGLRRVCLMLLAPIPWAGRVWALPILTALAPSERYDRTHGCATRRSPTGRASCCGPSGAVGDRTYAALERLVGAAPTAPALAPPP